MSLTLESLFPFLSLSPVYCSFFSFSPWLNGSTLGDVSCVLLSKSKRQIEWVYSGRALQRNVSAIMTCVGIHEGWGKRGFLKIKWGVRSYSCSIILDCKHQRQRWCQDEVRKLSGRCLCGNISVEDCGYLCGSGSSLCESSCQLHMLSYTTPCLKPLG